MTYYGKKWVVDLGDIPSSRECIGEIDGRLYDAILMNNLDATNRLLAEGVSVNVRDSAGVPILQKAIEWKASLSIIQCLLAAGALVDTQTPLQQTALWLAVSTNRIDVVECLLSAGASIDIKSSSTPLKAAAIRGHFSIVECLLFNRQIDIDSDDAKEVLNTFLQYLCVGSIMQVSIQNCCPNLLKLLFRHHPECYIQLDESYIEKLSASVGAIAEKLEGKALVDMPSKQMMQCLYLLYLTDIENVLCTRLNQFPDLVKELEQIAKDNGFFKPPTNEIIDIVKTRDWLLLSPLPDVKYKSLIKESCTDSEPNIRPGYLAR